MDAHKNFATSLVATAPSPATSGTSLVVTAGEGTLFPATPFNAVICPASANPTTTNAEIVRVTTISTDTFTITRTQESTSARTVVVGDRIYAGVTAKTLTDVETADAAAATASLRTLGTGSTQAMQGSLAAPLASPALTGTPTAPTAAQNTTTTQLASTAYADTAASRLEMPPTGVTFQNSPRNMSTSVATVGALTSGQLRLQAIWLPSGFTVTSLSFCAGTTALANGSSGSHFWFALFNSSRALLRQTNDDTAATFAASTLKTINLSSTFPTTYSGIHYLGIMCVAGSGGSPVLPTLAGWSTGVTTLINLAPIVGGSSTGSLTTTAPDPAGAIAATTGQAWCGVA